MSARSLVTALAAAVLVVLAARPAAAIYQCGPDKDDCQCGTNNPYPCCDNGGNCTWWAWEGACCGWAIGVPGWGNANQWVGNASVNPDFTVLGAPVASSIACRASGDYGHVAWVTAVNGGQISVTEQNCWGGWGSRAWDYQASFFDGGFIVPKAACECSGGQTQSEGCGRCGTRTRGCDGCAWGGFGACEGEGPCDPGQSDQQACGDCGSHGRACKPNCDWEAFGACAGPDPGDGKVACETDQKGVCSRGTQRCVDGTVQCQATASPTPEECDEIDNDCNGLVDDGVCDRPAWDAGARPDAGSIWDEDAGSAPPGEGAGGAMASAVDGNGAVVGGCACAAAGARAGASWGDGLGVLGLAFGLAARRLRRPARRRA